jgi:hypothetical protein
MLLNYLTIALRSLLRSKGTSFITIFGLALGMAACLLIALHVQDEFAYDRFHERKALLYRLYTLLQNDNGEERITAQPVPLAPTLIAEIPEIETATRLSGAGKTSIRCGTNVFRQAPTFTDPAFFTMFSFQFLQGTAATALEGLNNVVLTKELADKLFGTDAPTVGKTVQMMIDGVYQDFIVGGVIATPPSTSSLELSIIARFEYFAPYKEGKNRWNSWSHDVFVQLRNGVDAVALEPKLAAFAERHYAEDIADRKQAGVKPSPRGKYVEPRLQPITDLHFNTEIEPTDSARAFVLALAGVGVFIMLIACINFVNLSIARSVTRAKEVGVRKTLGAVRSDITTQFLSEAMVVVGLAMALSLAIAELLLPVFNAAMGKKLMLNVVHHWPFVGAVLLGLVLMGIAAGAYPAFYIARFRAALALTAAVRGESPRRVRNALVIVQFVIAIALIASTLVLVRQTEYLHTKSLGFDREHVVMIPIGNDAAGRTTLQRYKSLLAGRTDIISMSGCAKPIGRGLDGSDYQSNSSSTFRSGILKMALLRVDFAYTETMRIPLLAGRSLSEQFINADTTTSLVVNDAFARQVWELLPDAERKMLSNGTNTYSPQALLNMAVGQARDTTKKLTIVGVVQDFHFESLRHVLRPAVLFAIPTDDIRFVLVRIRPDNIPATMAALEVAWKQVSPDVPWQGSFLDDNIERQYRSQTRLMKLMVTGAGIAIVLSCIGLFALAAMIITARTKEIGIRKVLGASVASIIGLLSKDFLKLVAVAIIVATPIAWWFMRGWLEGFAYRVDLSWWVFALAGVLAVVIAFLTVASQAWRAARANPVHALRSE